MLRKVLIGKIHRARVTGADLDYMGSITIDPELIEAAGMVPLQEAEIWNVTNGERFSTYILPGHRGSGDVVLNGSAARRVAVGDVVIIASYGWQEVDSQTPLKARVVMVDEHNKITKRLEYSWEPKTQTFTLS